MENFRRYNKFPIEIYLPQLCHKFYWNLWWFYSTAWPHLNINIFCFLKCVSWYVFIWRTKVAIFSIFFRKDDIWQPQGEELWFTTGAI